MARPLSRSDKLITDMHLAALSALAEAPGGCLPRAQVMVEVEQRVQLDDWARETYETSGNTRWRSIFAFSSVGLVKAGYVIKDKATWTITDEGRHAIAPPFDPRAFLQDIDKRYRAWKAESLRQGGAEPQGPASSIVEEPGEELAPPEERIASILNEAHQVLMANLLEAIKSCDPAFFERLVVQLLLKMGYGGSRQEAGQAVGKSHDGGIDGIINEDRLGLDAIYLQAKRWEGVVGRPEIMKFVGALAGQRATKGVFITTSAFTQEARSYAANSQYKVVLIDGARLAELMIEHGLGVSRVAAFELMRLDSDYFSEE